MRRFANLFERLDRTTSTDAKVAALRDYFAGAPDADAAWAVHILIGGKLSRIVTTTRLREWAREVAGIEEWLFDESYAVVGDLAETIALLVDASQADRSASDGMDVPLSEWIETRILPLRALDPVEQRERVTGWWRTLDGAGVFLFTKLLTGALRVGVSRTLVIRALAQRADLDPADVAHRLMGDWRATPDAYRRLLAPGAGDFERSRPYPFFLASPLEVPAGDLDTAWLHAELGEARDWLAEWKWDGIRAQLIRRAGDIFLWSRGDENVTESFPEIVTAAARLPDGIVLDGEILAWREGRPLPFGALQRRLGRRTLGPRILREAPVAFVAYDALETDGADRRTEPIEARRERLERLLDPSSRVILMSELLNADSWSALAQLRAASRERAVEGLMLKRRGSVYQVGRRRGDWWKWKIDALSLDAVLVYAQPGHGRRANLLTDYTFAVWTGDGEHRALIPIAKAYSGLSDEEIRRLDRWIRRHTTERFGPVRAVEPTQVFELACDSVQRSPQRKAGLALRFPRIARRREDKPAAEADSLDDVRRLLRESNE